MSDVNRRLDQIEHLLRQHQVRQRRLETAIEEFRQWRDQVLELAKDLTKLTELAEELRMQESSTKASRSSKK